MAWCTVCEDNREIVYRTEGDTKAVPTVTKRYSAGSGISDKGRYIGYDEGEAYKTTVDSVPACKWCSTRFEFPTAQSKEQYFHAKKDLCVKQLRSRISTTYEAEEGPKWPAIIIGLIVGVAAILGINRVTGSFGLAFFLGLAIGLGAAYLVYRGLWSKKKEQTYEADRQSFRDETKRIETMQFSEENYQSLRTCRYEGFGISDCPSGASSDTGRGICFSGT